MEIFLEPSISNMRDLGGIKNKYDNVIRKNLIIRSNCPSNLKNKSLQYFKKTGINTIIDLRSADEYEEKISSFEHDNKFKLYHISIDEGKEIPQSREKVPLTYLAMVEKQTNEFAKIFQIIATNNGGILFFCNAGKDRTGVLAALILLLLDVEDNEIIDDYMKTKDCQMKFINDYIKDKKDKALGEIIIPHEEFMSDFLQLFRKKYNSAYQYLLSIGIKEDMLLTIRKKLLQ